MLTTATDKTGETMTTGKFLSGYEHWLTAVFLWRVARGSDITVLHAIYHVLRNRVRDSSRFPNNLTEVILQPGNFGEFYADSKFPNSAITTGWKAFIDCQDALTLDTSNDPTHGANYFESASPEDMPRWADPEKITAKIGPFRFYKL